jgi:hypothetical protein
VNPQLWWYVARAGGIVGWVLLAASVAWGLLLSTRLFGRSPSPAWVLDLHRWLGALAVVFTGVHLAGLVADSYAHFGPADLFVPLASAWRPGAVAWGVVGLYLLLAVEVTSIARASIPAVWWRRIHRSSFALFVVVTIHGAAAGTDASNVGYVVVGTLLCASTLFLTLVRVLTVGSPRRSARAASPGAVVDLHAISTRRPAPLHDASLSSRAWSPTREPSARSR